MNEPSSDVDQILAKASARINSIKSALAHLKSDLPLNYEFLPPGEFSKRPIGTKQSLTKHYEAQLKIVKDETSEAIKYATIDLSMAEKVQVYKKYDEVLYSDQTMEERTNEAKTIDDPQDLTLAQRNEVSLGKSQVTTDRDQYSHALELDLKQTQPEKTSQTATYSQTLKSSTIEYRENERDINQEHEID